MGGNKCRRVADQHEPQRETVRTSADPDVRFGDSSQLGMEDFTVMRKYFISLCLARVPHQSTVSSHVWAVAVLLYHHWCTFIDSLR